MFVMICRQQKNERKNQYCERFHSFIKIHLHAISNGVLSRVSMIPCIDLPCWLDK